MVFVDWLAGMEVSIRLPHKSTQVKCPGGWSKSVVLELQHVPESLGELVKHCELGLSLGFLISR